MREGPEEKRERERKEERDPRSTAILPLASGFRAAGTAVLMPVAAGS